MKSIISRFLEIFRSGTVRNYCSVCGMSGVAFQPLPDFYRQNAQRHGYIYFGKGEMTALDTYSCANCGASDRERLYAYWLQREIDRGGFEGCQKLIHFAPEQSLHDFICRTGVFEDHETADLMMDMVDHKVDLLSLPFPDNSYDFFICSHVLEHVPDDMQAIHELHRITRPGGRGILMSPIIVGLQNTIEDPSITAEAVRWRLFGQFDHVRLYAHDDYVNRIIAGGFKLQQLSQREFSEDIFARLGLKPTSILYLVTKQ